VTSRSLDPERRAALRALAAFPLIFVPGALLLAGSPFLRNNNVFPAVPAMTVLASVAAVEVWRRSAPWLGRFHRPAMAAAAFALLVLPPTVDNCRQVYASSVPTTEDAAFAILRGRLAQKARNTTGGIIFAEKAISADDPTGASLGSGDPSLLVVPVESLAAVGAERLAQADAEVFPESRLAGAAGAFYEARRQEAAAGGSLARAPSRFLGHRGPTLLLVPHSWQAISTETLSPLSGGPGGRLVFRLPDHVAAGETISLRMRLPRGEIDPPTLSVGARELELHMLPRDAPTSPAIYFTERCPAEQGALVTFSVHAGRKMQKRRGGAPITVELRRWRNATTPG
jgi:hypothetical protein